MTQITTTAVGGTSAGLKLKGLTDAGEIRVPFWYWAGFYLFLPLLLLEAYQIRPIVQGF